MEAQDREPEQGFLRREELHRVNKKTRNMSQKQQEEQPGTSGVTKEFKNSPETI